MVMGLKIWDSEGSLVMDSSHYMGRLIDNFEIKAGESGSHTIKGGAGKHLSIITLAVNSDIYFSYFSHEVTVTELGGDVLVEWVPVEPDGGWWFAADPPDHVVFVFAFG